MGFTLVPVYKENFIDRSILLDELYAELSNSKSNTGYALFGKRRVGKTSIFKELQWRLEEVKGIVPVYFSVWDLIEFTLLEFCQKLSIAILEAYRPRLGITYKIKELLKTPITVLRQILDRAQLGVAYKELEFLLSLNKNIDKDMLVENTFTLSERLSENLKCVLFIDEFPSIINLKDNNSSIGEPIIRKIRTIFEGWKKTSLCISGSIRSTMDLAVLSSSSPFYRQLIIKEVGPLDKKWVKELILRNLSNISEEAISEIYSFSNGIPFYIQFLGKMLEKQETISVKDIKDIEDEFLQEEGNIIFKEEFEKLSSKERIIMLALAKGARTPKAIVKEVGEKVSNINRFLSYLNEKGYISREEKGVYRIDDPVFSQWVEGISQ